MTTQELNKTKCAHLNQHLLFSEAIRKKKIVKARNDCKEVQWIHCQLKYWCIENNYEFEKEYRFAKTRKFRFDFALTEFKIGIEYDGLMSDKSGHTTLVGFTNDTEKINLAIGLGWRVLRYTVLNYRNVLQDLGKLLNT